MSNSLCNDSITTGEHDQMVRTTESRSKGLRFNSHYRLCVQVSGRFLIPCSLCPLNRMGIWWRRAEPWRVKTDKLCAPTLDAPRSQILKCSVHLPFTFTPTFPHKPLRDMKWPSATTRLTTQFTSGLISDLVICKHRKEYGHKYMTLDVLTETRCNKTTQTQAQFYVYCTSRMYTENTNSMVHSRCRCCCLINLRNKAVCVVNIHGSTIGLC